MQKKLSVIIPCYNCEATLEEAISSVAEQELSFPFEIVVVDDCSTDNTLNIIKNIEKKNNKIKYVHHTQNLGGGAARNTAVDNSTGELIFCLDSDDILTKGILSKLVAFQSEKHCDGVGVSTSKKFIHPDTHNIKYTTNFDYVGEKIPFESLLDGSKCSLYSTFLITREAFYSIRGYPTSHGFDTQGMAFRFLCNGFTAYVCPDTIYLHRVNQHQSYYLSEQKNGNINRNWFFVFEEFLYLFNNDIQKIILEYNLNPNENDQNLKDLISGYKDIFVENYNELVKLGKKKALNYLAGIPSSINLFCIGNQQKDEQNYSAALSVFQKSFKQGFNHWIIYFRMFESYNLSIGINPTAKNIVGQLYKQILSQKIETENLVNEILARIKRKVYLKIMEYKYKIFG